MSWGVDGQCKYKKWSAPCTTLCVWAWTDRRTHRDRRSDRYRREVQPSREKGRSGTPSADELRQEDDLCFSKGGGLVCTCRALAELRHGHKGAFVGV